MSCEAHGERYRARSPLSGSHQGRRECCLHSNPRTPASLLEEIVNFECTEDADEETVRFSDQAASVAMRNPNLPVDVLNTQYQASLSSDTAKARYMQWNGLLNPQMDEDIVLEEYRRVRFEFLLTPHPLSQSVWDSIMSHLDMDLILS